LSGPPEFCEAKAPISVCASITILVPISWLAATLCAYDFSAAPTSWTPSPPNSFPAHPVLGYFVAISTLCITHLRLYPALWSTSIYTIVWFVDDGAADKRSAAPQIPPLETSGPTRLSVFSRRHSTSSIPRDVENQPSGNPNLDKPLPVPSPTPSSNVWWGRLLPGRAGRDHPFGFRRAKGPDFKWWANEQEQEAGDNDPPKYPGSQPQTPGESRFLPYPSESLNENEPIPVDNRSEWVRAEQALRA
jgi:hypothetical protein